MIKGLAHICINTTDLQKTEWFYCDVLGLKKKFEFTKEGKVTGFYVRLCEGNYLEFFETNEKFRNESPINHFCIETESIDDIATVLSANLIEVTDKKLGCDNSWQIWTEDPNGIKIEFHEYTKESLQYNGGTCEIDW